MLLEDPSKSKRSLQNADREVVMHPDCESFSVGHEASKSFNSPGYPENYTKNISCVRVLTGKKEKVVHLLIKPGEIRVGCCA